jgi:hypothetical protein
MPKRPSFGSQFEKLRALGTGKPSDAHKPPVVPRSSATAPSGGLTPLSSILEQSLSTLNSGVAEQYASETESKADTVQTEQSQAAKTVQDGPFENETVATVDTVQIEPCPELTESAVDSLAAGFTRVPHSLLRGEGRFEDPLDFMVYLHLFTFSHGFGRKDAYMSQAQLEKFTGAAKNTVKRSLDRLRARGWIKCVEEYERAQMARKWRVLVPEERSGRSGLGGSKKPGSKADSGRNEQSPERTGTLSAVDTPALSKMDTFLDITYPASHLPEVTCE